MENELTNELTKEELEAQIEEKKRRIVGEMHQLEDSVRNGVTRRAKLAIPLLAGGFVAWQVFRAVRGRMAAPPAGRAHSRRGRLQTAAAWTPWLVGTAVSGGGSVLILRGIRALAKRVRRGAAR